MEGSTTPDRDELLAFELALDEKVCDEVRRESWGRLFLTRSAPLIWDANWVGIEEVGLSLERLVAIADEVLGGAGFDHRTVCLLDEADGRRVGAEMEAAAAHWPGWEVERTRYMVWRGDALDPGLAAGDAEVGVREVPLAAIEGLRRALIAEETAPTGVPEPRGHRRPAVRDRPPLRHRGWRPLVHRPGRGRAALLLSPAQRRADRPGRGRRHPLVTPASAATPRRS